MLRQAQQPNQQLTVTESSRSAASHPICHSVGVSKSKESPTIFYALYAILLILCSIPTHSQPYQWQWAIKGGSVSSMSGASWHLYAEQIYDLAIDQNNNYYFVASITTPGFTQLNGQPVTTYGNPNVGNDVFLFSTTCNGMVRWSQAIGGGLLILLIK